MARLRPVLAWFRHHGDAIALFAAVAVFAWLARPMLLPPNGSALTHALAPTDTVKAKGKRISILLAGDTHFGESYADHPSQSALDTDRYAGPLSGVSKLASSADLAIVNLETPLGNRESSPLDWVKKWAHWGAAEPTARALQKLGIRAVSLANNHACDALGAGLVATRGALDRQGIRAFGAGSNLQEASAPYRLDLVVGERTLRLAILGAFERSWGDWAYGVYATSSGNGTYPLAQSTITSQIRALKLEDPELFVLVFPHWGKNYAWRSEAQESLGRAMIDAGADLVVGHGAHLFQEVEPYRDRLVLYSLGNFIFLAPGRYSQQHMHPLSLAARLDFTEKDSAITLELRLYFLASNNLETGYRPHVVGSDDFDHAVRRLIDSGEIPVEARDRLRELAQRGKDEVGPYLRLKLGAVPAAR